MISETFERNEGLSLNGPDLSTECADGKDAMHQLHLWTFSHMCMDTCNRIEG